MTFPATIVSWNLSSAARCTTRPAYAEERLGFSERFVLEADDLIGAEPLDTLRSTTAAGLHPASPIEPLTTVPLGTASSYTSTRLPALRCAASRALVASSGLRPARDARGLLRPVEKNAVTVPPRRTGHARRGRYAPPSPRGGLAEVPVPCPLEAVLRREGGGRILVRLVKSGVVVNWPESRYQDPPTSSAATSSRTSRLPCPCGACAADAAEAEPRPGVLRVRHRSTQCRRRQHRMVRADGCRGGEAQRRRPAGSHRHRAERRHHLVVGVVDGRLPHPDSFGSSITP